MPCYAMVVVVEAPDETRAHDLVGTAIPDADTSSLDLNREAYFIGEPWEVQPRNADALAAGERVDEDDRLRAVAEFSPEFDTLDCFDQHPER